MKVSNRLSHIIFQNRCKSEMGEKGSLAQLWNNLNAPFFPNFAEKFFPRNLLMRKNNSSISKNWKPLERCTIEKVIDGHWIENRWKFNCISESTNFFFLLQLFREQFSVHFIVTGKLLTESNKSSFTIHSKLAIFKVNLIFRLHSWWYICGISFNRNDWHWLWHFSRTNSNGISTWIHQMHLEI